MQDHEREREMPDVEGRREHVCLLPKLRQGTEVTGAQ